ncbi:hypothetical protein [Prosthecobacter vanneervenii]|uniref:Uncharacterized protein n=1 Tax=Prosthecobacter vanneervenii TaxID=48466 RepID=A0A7W7Y6H6_9BACT|nr:hypothetical protein [Prosthecobacter vanneervenii]MBB5030523.1 hypothetical protein [Prosthecobacter vanneervenii]
MTEEINDATIAGDEDVVNEAGPAGAEARLFKTDWVEGEETAYGFKVVGGVLSGPGGSWPIRSIASIQVKTADKAGFWEAIGCGSATAVSVFIEGREITVLRIEHPLFERPEVWFDKQLKCKQVVNLVTHFMKKEAMTT